MDLGTEAIFLAFLFTFAIPAAVIGGWLMSRIAAGHGWLVLAAFAWGVVCIAGVPLVVWLGQWAGVFGLNPPRYDGAWDAASFYALASGLIGLPAFFAITGLTYALVKPEWWPVIANAFVASTLLLLVPWLSWYFIVFRYDPRTCAHECYPELGPFFIWILAAIPTGLITLVIAAIGWKVSGRDGSSPGVAA